MSKMTPEDVLSAVVAHASTVDHRRPDPLVMAAAEGKRGRMRPGNWRAVRDEKGKIDVAASWPSLRTALGHDSRRLNKQTRHEVAADALSQMPLRYWQALQVAIGINSSARDAVYQRLLRTARISQQRDGGWPAKIERRRTARQRAPAEDYVPDLVELVVMQLEQPQLFATHRQRADWFGLRDAQWYAVMQKPFDVVSGRAWAWYHAGIGHIQNRLRRRLSETA